MSWIGPHPPGGDGPVPLRSGRVGCSTGSRQGPAPSSPRTRPRSWGVRPSDPLVQASTREAFALLRALLVRHVQHPGLGRRGGRRARSGSTGIEHVEKGLAEGKGVVIALPHTGNWDVGGRAMAAPGRSRGVGGRAPQAGAPVRAVPRAPAAAGDGHHRPVERPRGRASSRNASRRTGSSHWSPTATSPAAASRSRCSVGPDGCRPGLR